MPSDGLRTRLPTSHERTAGRPWDASYADGPPPWDIGAPQPAVVRLAARGAFSGAVLDAGCGTGENALHLAGLGLSVLGVDLAPTAIAMAQAEAARRGSPAQFLVADAFRLERLGRVFSSGLDCGLFHACDATERLAYAASVAAAIAPGGALYVLCFSDQCPDAGPHPVTQAEIGSAFHPATGWRVLSIEPERLAARIPGGGAPAWLATLQRR